MIDKTHFRYIIIGGGISGLKAAENLAKMGQSFILLEATHRFGGKMCTLDLKQAIQEDQIEDNYPWLEEIKGVQVQVGATWVSDVHTQMKSIMKSYGIVDVPQYYQGKKIVALSKNNVQAYDHGSQFFLPYKEKTVKLLKFIQAERHRYQNLMKCKKQGTITEEQTKQLKQFYLKYDTILASDFVSQFLEDEELAHIFNEEVLVLQSIQTKYISAIQLIIEEGNLENIEYFTGLINDCIDGNRVRGGVRTILKAVEESIRKELSTNNIDPEAHLLKKHVVKAIHNSQNPVRVVVQNGKQFTCEKAILALPSGTVKFISIDSMSKGKRIIVENQLHSIMSRITMVFKTPFWRDLGYSGNVSFYHQYPMRELVQLTPEDKCCGIIGFVIFQQGRRKWESQIDQKCSQFNLQGNELKRKRNEILKQQARQVLADLFTNGDPTSPLLQEFIIFTRSMSDVPYIRDTYNATLAPETMLKINEVDEDHKNPYGCDEPNIIILGSDFSDHPGYMEGAVRIANLKINPEYLAK